MYISSHAARNMASVIITETQGEDRLSRQQPLTVIDQGDRWLVFGRPYADEDAGLDHCQFYVIYLKNNAEIVGLGSEGSLKIDLSAKQLISGAGGVLTDRELERAFGPREIDQLDGSDFKINLQFNEFLYGGLVNSVTGAINYALHILESASPSQVYQVTALTAEEKSGVWHISIHSGGKGHTTEPILEFSRVTGQVLACNC